ncbi:MAG: NADPH-dependent FMN reductase [Actinomycetota bacterium]
MASLLGLVGSLRSGSVNGLVARTAAGLVDELTLHDLRSLPLYDGDAEESGPPSAATDLHTAVVAADGIVFFTPEYNSSFPAVTKNAVDWMSRPPRAYDGKAVTMIVASPGGRAGLGVREHFETTMAHQPVRLFETLGLGRYGDRLTPDGTLDTETTDEVVDFLGRFGRFASESG